MRHNEQIRSFVFFNRTGCLLPLLIMFNLLFGWIFLKPKEWLITEAVLLLFFIINGYIITRKIISGSSAKRHNVIDIEGKVVEDKHRLK